jgi:hypothetical protein
MNKNKQKGPGRQLAVPCRAVRGGTGPPRGVRAWLGVLLRRRSEFVFDCLIGGGLLDLLSGLLQFIAAEAQTDVDNAHTAHDAADQDLPPLIAQRQTADETVRTVCACVCVCA